MRHMSLCTGYGGIDLALEAVWGAETVAVADIDPGACKILAHRYPGVPNLGDISSTDWSAWAGKVDVLSAGFPCQDVSTAGARAGLLRGENRSGVWAFVRDAIATIRPPLVLLENVRGLLSARADSDVEPCPWCLGDEPDEPALRALGAVLGDLADLGFDARWYGLRAADVGAAHGRFRVFVYAWPADAERDTRRLLDGDRGSADAGSCEAPAGLSLLPTPKVTDEHHSSPADGDRNAPGLRAIRYPLPTPEANTATNGGSQHPDKRRAGGHSINLQDAVEHLLPTPAVNDMGAGKTPDAWDAWIEAMQAKHGNGNGHGKSLEIEAQRLLPTTRATDGTKGGPNQHGSSGDLMLPSAVQDWREYEPAIRRQEQAFGRPAPAPTEPGKNGQPRLSPRFSEWLMGLPDRWVTDPAIWVGMTPTAARNAQLKALGNGVVPQQCAAAVEAFRADLLAEVAA